MVFMSNTNDRSSRRHVLGMETLTDIHPLEEAAEDEDTRERTGGIEVGRLIRNAKGSILPRVQQALTSFLRQTALCS